jgi:hypothetical protein
MAPPYRSSVLTRPGIHAHRLGELRLGGEQELQHGLDVIEGGLCGYVDGERPRHEPHRVRLVQLRRGAVGDDVAIVNERTHRDRWNGVETIQRSSKAIQRQSQQGGIHRS